MSWKQKEQKMRVFIACITLFFLNLFLRCEGLAHFHRPIIHFSRPKVSGIRFQRLIHKEKIQPADRNTLDQWNRNDFTNLPVIDISDISDALCAFCENYARYRHLCKGKICSMQATSKSTILV